MQRSSIPSSQYDSQSVTQQLSSEARHGSYDLTRRSAVRLLLGAPFAFGSPKSIALGLSDSTMGDREDPHFFLQIHVSGGLDCNYLFDARPLAMTGSKLQVNYSKNEAIRYTGVNGQETLRNPLTDPLMKHLDRFSVLNGVLMVHNFDGHEQNQNFLFTGNAFGGESYVPFINAFGKKAPLDYIKAGSGFLPIAASNLGNSLALNKRSLKLITQKVLSSKGLVGDEPLVRFLSNRLSRLSNKESSFGLGSRLMKQGLADAATLQDALTKIELPDETAGQMLSHVQLAVSAMRAGITRSALLSQGFTINQINVDSHDFNSASRYPELIRQYVQELDDILSYLRNTPFDAHRSMLDVTTVITTTEMSRSMRSSFSDSIDFDKTATDHNPLRNSFLIGGKGVRGGMVVGMTDYRTPDENLSKAHLALDSKKKLIMGRPFDFDNFMPRSDLPEGFAVTDYISSCSVANTIMKLFSVSKEKYFNLDRSGTIAARTLDRILV